MGKATKSTLPLGGKVRRRSYDTSGPSIRKLKSANKAAAKAKTPEEALKAYQEAESVAYGLIHKKYERLVMDYCMKEWNKIKSVRLSTLNRYTWLSKSEKMRKVNEYRSEYVPEDPSVLISTQI